MAKLFSLKPQFSKKIFLGEKLVEFRRQNVNVARREVCLIYTSHPIKKIEGYFIVEEKIRLPIQDLWKRTKDFAGIDFEGFLEYFKGCEFGTAIVFKSVRKIEKGLTLQAIRKIVDSSFRPPQSYCNIYGDLEKVLSIATL